MPDHLASFKARQNLSNFENDDMDRRLIELSALFEIGQTLNSSLNLQSILNNVLLVPMGRMMVGKGIILLKKDKSKSKYCIETLKGLPHDILGKEIDIIDLPLHSAVVNDISEEKEWRQFFKEFKIEILIPFIARNDTLGLMGFGNKITGKSYTDDEIEFLTSLSNIATTSIENALVFKEIHEVNKQRDQKIQELNTLFDIGKELNLTFEKDKILKLLSYALMGQVTVNNFIITVKDNGKFKAELVKGSSFTIKSGDSCKGICDKCSFMEKPYLVTGTSDLDNFLNENGIRVAVPMKIQNETRGYLFLSDKITKQSYSPSDLEFLQTLGNVAIISLENARLFQETLEKQKLEEEMAMARNIQNRLLPKTMPEFPNIMIHGINVPSKHVGGDYFDIIKIDDNRIGLTIADVSGKGMPASLLMSNLQASLHSLAREEYPLDKLVGRINNVIYNNTDPEKYITYFYSLLDLHTLELTFVNAGHNPPYLLHSDNKVEELSEGGIILGMMPDMPYETGTVVLQKGDTLMMYTDGVTEAMTVDEEEYEEKRLLKFMKRVCPANPPEKINKRLIKELNKFVGEAPQGDDITILTIQITK